MPNEICLGIIIKSKENTSSSISTNLYTSSTVDILGTNSLTGWLLQILQDYDWKRIFIFFNAAISSSISPISVITSCIESYISFGLLRNIKSTLLELVWILEKSFGRRFLYIIIASNFSGFNSSNATFCCSL